MQWNKAGRRKNPLKEEEVKKQEQHKQQVDSKPWTKGEMRVVPDPVLALASAVIKQWKRDGKPKQDKDAVLIWASIIQSYSIDRRK